MNFFYYMTMRLFNCFRLLFVFGFFSSSLSEVTRNIMLIISMVKIWNIWTNSLHSDAKLILINSFLQCIRGNWEKAFLICCTATSTIVHLLLSKETTLLKETHCLKKLHCLKKPLIIKKLHCLKKLTASWHWWNNICNILVK